MATEKRLIWAHKAEELIKNFGKGAIEDGLKSLDPVDDIVLLANGVDLIPTVDAVEVVHGHWIPIPEHENKRCSVCRIVFPDFTLGYYCPHCGAKMDGDWNG